MLDTFLMELHPEEVEETDWYEEYEQWELDREAEELILKGRYEIVS